MRDFLDLTIQVITIDIFIGFGVFSFLYVLITLFKKDINFLTTLDSKAVRFIIFTGLVYLTLVTVGTIYSLTTSDGKQTRGQYWWAPWLQPLIWTVITQLFWIKKIREIKILRIIIAILLIISFERYVIIVTSFHRDYLPGTWAMFSFLTPTEIILGLTAKVIVFVLLSTLYSFIADRLKLIASNAAHAGNNVHKP